MKTPDNLWSTYQSSPVNSQISKDVSNTTPRYYKNINPEKLYGCSCSLCIRVGLSHIIKQYIDFKNILIEDHNPSLIYDVFSEKVSL
jgi:hypothetical protein